MDGRKYNGGARVGAGRKSRAVELKAHEKGLEAIVSIYGSEKKYWEMVAYKAEDSFPHLKLIHEYTYGRSVETQDISSGGMNPLAFLDMSVEQRKAYLDKIGV